MGPIYFQLDHTALTRRLRRSLCGSKSEAIMLHRSLGKLYSSHPSSLAFANRAAISSMVENGIYAKTTAFPKCTKTQAVSAKAQHPASNHKGSLPEAHYVRRAHP